MANLKFYKMAQAPVGTTEKPLEAGAIWFNTTNHSIEVYNGATWSAFSGVLDAVVANEVLTVTKYDGSTVSVDFSIYATDEALSLLDGRVTTLEGTVATHGGNISDLQGRMTTVEGKASAAETKLAGLTGTVVEDIAAAVLVEENRAKGVEGGLDTRLGNLETTVNTDHEGRIAGLEAKFTGEDSVADQIADAVAAAEGRVDEKLAEKLAEKVDKSVYEAYVEANDAAVDALEAEDVLINEKIGSPVEVEGVSAYSKDYTVGQDVKAAKDAAKEAKDAADAAQQTIDEFLTGEGIDATKIDSLKDILAYIEEHGTEFSEHVEAYNALAELVGEGTVDSRIATAKGEIIAEIEKNEETTAAALTELDGRVDALEALSAGTEISGIKGRLDTLETEVNTNIPQDIADAKAGAEATAAADATAKANAAQAAAEAKAAELANAAQAAGEAAAATAKTEALSEAKSYTDGEIDALEAKINAGLQWVAFE